MKKVLIIVVGLALVGGVAGGAYFWKKGDSLSQQKAETGKNLPQFQPEVTGADQPAGQTVTDKLSGLIKNEKPMKCTWDYGEGYTGMVYIHNQKLYVEVFSQGKMMKTI